MSFRKVLIEQLQHLQIEVAQRGELHQSMIIYKVDGIIK